MKQMTPKTQLRWDPGTKHRVGRCHVLSCGSSTKGGKSFCSRHVEREPYVQRLLAQIAGREAEEARVGRVGARAVDPAGITSQEIVGLLRVNGGRSIKRMARDLSLPMKTMQGYVRALRRRGHVVLTSTQRGTPMVCLPEQVGAQPDPEKPEQTEAA